MSTKPDLWTIEIGFGQHISEFGKSIRVSRGFASSINCKASWSRGSCLYSLAVNVPRSAFVKWGDTVPEPDLQYRLNVRVADRKDPNWNTVSPMTQKLSNEVIQFDKFLSDARNACATRRANADIFVVDSNDGSIDHHKTDKMQSFFKCGQMLLIGTMIN